MPIVIISIIFGSLITMTAIAGSFLLKAQKQKLDAKKDSEELEFLEQKNKKLEDRVQNLEETFAEIDMDFLRLKPHDNDK